MSNYSHPQQDAEFILEHLLDFDNHCQQLGLEGINVELASAVLGEAGKLGSDVLAPLNKTGDQQGVTLTEAGVQQTPGFSEAYQQFMQSGWPSLTAPEAFGGQQLPQLLGTAVNEIWHSANLSFALCPMLSQGAVEALIAHGSEALQQTYLPPLISGEWTGTMNLTEPQAGSDLASVSSRAVPEDDHYRISGQKIYITWGDHQMTANIVHLVLARLPDAPAGVKGISLFIVPKYLLDAEGNPGALNDVTCVSLEHKLGIHGSPTCALSFGDEGGAIGYLVGDANKGLKYMFTMMNNARQAVGLQGLAISERAYQQSVVFAQERTQGRRQDGSGKPIIEYPDVRRMLMLQKAGTQAMRALAYVAAAEVDLAEHSSSAEHKARAELLTPIVKGWMTELAQELTSLNIQVHGGMGYIEETGAAQYYRDARILTIYEGTTGIQALDLIGRKTLMDQGQAYQQLLSEMTKTAINVESSVNPQLKSMGQQLLSAIDEASGVLRWLLKIDASSDQAGAASFDFLMLSGYLCGGWLLAKSAFLAEQQLQQAAANQPFLEAKIATSGFYFNHLMPRIGAHAQIITADRSSIGALTPEQL
ncbi:MAG: alkylation response protein AidB-like acyl-CoA dehydrogenase [Motiliproteus sp.]|jgi:alkylation response protein AidB-like acyl-CoA dehydrogenase